MYGKKNNNNNNNFSNSKKLSRDQNLKITFPKDFLKLN